MIHVPRGSGGLPQRPVGGDAAPGQPRGRHLRPQGGGADHGGQQAGGEAKERSKGFILRV